MGLNVVERVKICGNETAKHLQIQHTIRYEFAAETAQVNWLVADLPSGTGYGSAILARAGCCVIGADKDVSGIKFAREYHNQNLIADLTESLPMKANTFDMIVCFEFLEHIPIELAKVFLKQCKTLLKSNGILLVSTPVKKPIDFSKINPYHVNEMDPFELEQLVAHQGFTVLKRFGQSPLTRVTYPILSFFILRGILSNNSDPRTLRSRARTKEKNRILKIGRSLVHKIAAMKWNCELKYCSSTKELSLFSNQLLVLRN
jgi:SAM-dependent methyltransferase